MNLNVLRALAPPEVDTGGFIGRQAGEERAWVWKSPMFPAYEVWISYNGNTTPGQEALAFERPNQSAAIDIDIELASDILPPPQMNSDPSDPANVFEFLTAVMTRKGDFNPQSYLVNRMWNHDPPSGDLLVDVPMDTGLYEISQSNGFDGPQLRAWVWRPGAVGSFNPQNRELWLLYRPGQIGGYRLPGNLNPQLTFNVAGITTTFDPDAEWPLNDDPTTAYTLFRQFVLDGYSYIVGSDTDLTLVDHSIDSGSSDLSGSGD